MEETAYPGVGPELYRDIAERTQGDIYIGVVGPVRTGKSTFIKRFMELMVLGNDERLQLVARFDNLGKGSSGAALQCLNLMLGAPETLGLNL